MSIYYLNPQPLLNSISWFYGIMPMYPSWENCSLYLLEKYIVFGVVDDGLM